MYSALKHKGKPLHALARKGIEVKRKPRRVEIDRLALTEWEPPACTLEVACSPGTYVRALAHDLGQALGCGAHLTGLVRLASGDFFLESAVTLETFAQAAAEGGWPDLLHPMDAALARFPALHLDSDAARRLCSGQAVPPPSPSHKEEGMLARVYGPDGVFLAVAAYDQTAGTWSPHKVFHSSNP
jgi:tRNA pseudouridine55 synthase